MYSTGDTTAYYNPETNSYMDEWNYYSGTTNTYTNEWGYYDGNTGAYYDSISGSYYPGWEDHYSDYSYDYSMGNTYYNPDTMTYVGEYGYYSGTENTYTD